MAEPVTRAAWEAALNAKSPWWREMAAAALDRIALPPPESHARREVREGRPSWDGTDSLFQALQYLDQVLATERELPFAELQDRLTQTVAERWSGWPPFTRVTVVSCLRTLFWADFPALRAILADILRSDAPPQLLNVAVPHAVRLAQSTPLPELEQFLRRAAAGGYDEALRHLGPLLGSAAVWASDPTAGAPVRALQTLFVSVAAWEWASAASQRTFLQTALWGASNALGHEAPSPACADAWLAVATTALNRWPHPSDASQDRQGLPLHALCAGLDAVRPPAERERVFLGLVAGFEMILRRGTLGDFAQLHHELRALLAGTRRVQGAVSPPPLAVVAEEPFPALFRVATERVAAWRRARTTTNDGGWGSALQGRDTIELLKVMVDRSRDRARLRREVVSSIDLLADAGLNVIAAEASVYLRRLEG